MARVSQMSAALLSAAFFALGSIFLIVAANIEHGEEWNSTKDFRQPFIGGVQDMDATQAEVMHRNSVVALARRWDARTRAKSSFISGSWMMGGAWFAAMPVVDTLASVLQAEQAGESAGSKVRLAFVTAAILSIIEFTSEAGTAQTTTWISTWPMMRDAVSDPDPSQYFGALQTLEMTYLIAKSRTIWLYALVRAAPPPRARTRRAGT